MFDVLSSNTQASAPRRVIFDVIRLGELFIGQVQGGLGKKGPQ